jgi:hypothetical protein
MAVRNLQKTSQTRLFLIEDRANPASVPSYQSLARALGLSWPQGDITPIRVPDPDQYGRFVTVDNIRGQQGLPTISIESRLTRDISSLLDLVRKGCSFDVQLHAGACEDPRDFNGGWEKIYVLEAANATSYDTNEFGALDADQEAVVTETVPLSGEDWYEVKKIVGSELGAAQIVQEVVDIAICDSRQCGECGITSNGCEKVFAVTLSAGGSPGLPAEVIFSADAGATMDDTIITSLGANEDPDALACVGIYLVVVSNDSESLHYAPLVDILAGNEIWTEIATGFVALKGPNAIFSLSSVFTWIVGDGGYIYFSDDITAGVEVQSAGAQSTEDLNAIHGSDELNLVAVGDNNTVLFTNNGGASWASVTGPVPAVNLLSVWVKSPTVWLVGSAGGRLYYTQDGGANWTEKAFSGNGAGQVRDISFATPTVGYMAHHTATPAGRILRTINGGGSWYVLPEAAGLSLPSNDRFDAVAACSENPNLVFGAGLADNAVDGIVVKVA